MVTRSYVPDAGDLVWLDFHPQAGREQTGRRPAVVLSPATYNAKAGFAVACPVTSAMKGYPFEVLLPESLPVHGVVLSDQIRSIDWRERRATRLGKLPADVLQRIRDNAAVLLGIQ